MNQAVEDILLAKNGFVSSADVDTLGIPRATLARSASNGELLRISRSLYCTPMPGKMSAS
ncbi:MULTISPECIES: type IV toxin-antitoxin system AbiEi family antitoxin domain-containing protein [Adlercreutzia]|uniref:type IV toxin-antitoxin system AbiEi family antitoxin domain-containing protein n=1 Tax=Adlercreutzia TaxID=447020 RepID=UPI00214CDE55|nr:MULTISPECIES: type IV toxin-antitoxin system AbiEi family antitoxin domain-containing protein [Adlercreutzia]MCR2028752.1 type IV toxin-antitoxin system AbiEi family antitoxin domain-containing protein [Adlercreutzia muris]MCU7585641.1 type IV toxin-antitoxin system AbiEi family antitoxin domain-containing protein [Adlercreutzia muris]